MKLKLQQAPRPLVKTNTSFHYRTLSVLAWLRLVRTGEMLLEARFFIGKLQVKAAATELANCGTAGLC
jgi:hypothetical protein